MSERQHVCPVERASGLDFKLRGLLQNPQKILKGFVKEGMTAVDIGCGPGFFSLDMAQMVGENGKVICVDLQQGMLDIVSGKIKNTELEDRISLHKCDENKIGVSENVDFILTFYMIHEVPDKKAFFSEVKNMLKENGKMLIVEPNFHVSKANFNETINIAEECGLKTEDGPRLFLSQTQIFLNN